MRWTLLKRFVYCTMYISVYSFRRNYYPIVHSSELFQLSVYRARDLNFKQHRIAPTRSVQERCVLVWCKIYEYFDEDRFELIVDSLKVR